MTAQLLKPSPENIAKAAALLRAGQVVGMPTETVYGLAGHALLPEALTRIFETKERPTFDPLIVHVAQKLGAQGSVLDALGDAGLVELARISPRARAVAARLLAEFWPGPLTMVLPKSSRVPDLATSGLPSVALRMPRHPVAQALLEATGFPLAAPSANRFGRISPTSAEAVREELGDRIELILDGGRCEVGVESTVLALNEDGGLFLLRPGGIPAARLEEISGRALVSAATHGSVGKSPGSTAQLAPGMLESHYAPRTRFELLPTSVGNLTAPPESAPPAPARVGLLAFDGESAAIARAFARLLGDTKVDRLVVRVLSPRGDLGEAARNLFALMRELDATGVAQIFAEPCPRREGLGHAIADRLTRAATRDK